MIVEHEDRLLTLESVWKHSLELSYVLEKLDSFGGCAKLDEVILVPVAKREADGSINCRVESLLCSGVKIRITIR